MEEYIIIVVLFGFVGCLLLVGLFFYNRLLLYRKLVEREFEPVRKTFLEMRDITLEMSSFVSQNLHHEEDYLKKLDRANHVFSSVSCCNGGFDLVRQAKNTYLDFGKLVQVYPKLEKNSDYLDINKRGMVLMDRALYSFSSYDEKVRWYRSVSNNQVYSFFKRVRKLAEFDLYGE